jgi:hypothetical protein
MVSVGAKGCGYSALANGSTTVMQPTRAEEDETPHEMKELLPRGTGGPETNSSFTGKGSVETATAGCEEEDWEALLASIRTRGRLVQSTEVDEAYARAGELQVYQIQVLKKKDGARRALPDPGWQPIDGSYEFMVMPWFPFKCLYSVYIDTLLCGTRGSLGVMATDVMSRRCWCVIDQ